MVAATSPQSVDRLATAYEDVNDVDLFTGVLLLLLLLVLFLLLLLLFLLLLLVQSKHGPKFSQVPE